MSLWPDEFDLLHEIPEAADSAPADWQDWVPSLFPQHVPAPFGEHHIEFWEWVWSIEQQSSPRPFVAIWARGGAKSTSAELGTTALGVRGRRKYALYVRETQEQADKSVANIAALLESDAVARYYPKHADRMISKFGSSRGWRRNRLRTSGGFTVDAIGLDTAARGVKVEEQRPDLIVLDDIDDKHDSPATTARKIATITASLLPAGSGNVAVLAIQNLIIPDGIFTRLADGRADFLSERIVSGPYPAVRDLETEWHADPESGARRAVITAGTATWDGQSIESCQRLIDTMGLTSFLKECQHQVKELAEGIVLKRFHDGLVEPLSDDECREIVGMGQAFAGLDFGAWRFAFVLRAADRGGRVRQIAEYFSQREELETRARVIHCINSFYGVPAGIKQWGDAANPTDILELNAAFRRIKSPYHVIPVGMGNKLRKASVERMDDLHQREALLYRRDVHTSVNAVVAAQWKTLGFPGAAPQTRRWRLGFNAASAGVEMDESRLLWEVKHWSYPVPTDGVAQKQDPDDNTADGADLIAADRYAIMSWWKPPKVEEKPVVKKNYDPRFDKVIERLNGTSKRRDF